MRFSTNWYSQAGQDKWITEIFKNKKNGYFIDIGAADGWGDSNTWYLEEKLGWTGVCVECGVQDFLKCSVLRKKSFVTNSAIWNEETDLIFTVGSHSVQNGGFGVPVKAITLKTLFERYNVPNQIDYISLDIEGSEIEALEGFPWDTHMSIAWTIEHNSYRGSTKMKTDVHTFMTNRGYVRVVEDITCKDSNWGAFEDWYLHKDYVHLNKEIDLSFAKIK